MIVVCPIIGDGSPPPNTFRPSVADFVSNEGKVPTMVFSYPVDSPGKALAIIRDDVTKAGTMLFHDAIKAMPDVVVLSDSFVEGKDQPVSAETAIELDKLGVSSDQKSLKEALVELIKNGSPGIPDGYIETIVVNPEAAVVPVIEVGGQVLGGK